MDEVRVGCRLLLAVFTGLTLLAVLGLLVGASRTHHDSAWRIHTELTAAFLGAAFAAGFVLSLLSLRERRWSRIRVPVLTVTVYTVLALTATIVHDHGLQLFAVGASARFTAWFWLVVHLVVPVACLAVVLGHEVRRGRAEPVHRPIPAWPVVLLAVQGAGPDPTGHPAVAYTVFGVLELLVLLRYRTEVSADDPWLWVYVASLLPVVGSGGYGWWAGRRRADDRLVVPTRPGQATEYRA